MNDITPETISCYADGELSPKERTEVEQALRDDPLLAAELDEMEDLAAYFGHIEPEAVPEELTDRLYAIDTPVEGAGQVPGPAGAGLPWLLGRRASLAATGEAGTPAGGDLRR